MRGIRFAMLIALPFILGALYTGINLFYYGKDDHLFYFLGFLVVGLAIFFAKEEINYWYDEKYPPRLDHQITVWLENFFPFYNTLESDDRQKFETRLALYLNARSFHLMLKEKKSIPEDFKAIIAAHGIQMTLGQKDFLIGDYDRIICYNHPFPTPGNKFLHTVEVHHEDGLILLSIEQLMMSIGHPTKHYNIAYHAYAEVLLTLYPQLQKIEEAELQNLMTYDLGHIAHITGFENINPKTLSLAAFFIHNSEFKKHWPEQHSNYQEILNYDY